MPTVKLFSVDIGTTTCCAVVFAAEVEKNPVSGRSYLRNATPVFQSEIVFTPFSGPDIDEQALTQLINTWLQQAQVNSKDLFTGGVIMTGLCAKKNNAASVSRQIKQLVGDTVIHTIDDPNLEAWLAYKGSMDQRRTADFILNMDIGGGTCNVAIGRGSNVLATGCYAIGARHLRFVPGTYQLLELSTTAENLLAHLNMFYRVGDQINPADIITIVEFSVTQLQCIANAQVVAPFLIESPLQFAQRAENIQISGGIGEIIQNYFRGGQLPGQTAFGDLGGELASAIIASGLLGEKTQNNRKTTQPSINLSRATALGMALHNTEISSNTIYLSAENLLPLVNLPLIGFIDQQHNDTDLARLLAVQNTIGGAIYLGWPMPDLAAVKYYANKMRELMDPNNQQTLVFLLNADVGASFGNYLTAWRQTPWRLAVIDGIEYRDAAFINLGAQVQQVVPVAFFGVHYQRETYVSPP